MTSPVPGALVALSLVVVALTAPSIVSAHEDAAAAVAITVEAREGAACPEGRTFCFAVTHGDLATLEPGTTVRLTFVNDGDSIHNVAITRLADADPEHRNTSMMGLFAGSAEEVAPNATQTFFFHIPADADGIYLWCHIVGHERLGMWMEQDLPGEPATDDHDGEGARDIPAVAGGALAATIVGAAVLLTRRRG